MIKRGLFLAIFFLFFGCSTKNIEISSNNLKNEKYLDISYVPQQDYYCAPSSLLMIFKYWHKKGFLKNIPKFNDIVKKIYIPSKKGAFQIELKSFVREYNLLYFEKRAKLEDILKLIDEDIPVIVLLNLSFKNYPIWHYAVVYGYNIDKKEIFLRSRKKEEILTFYNFYNLHKKADFWSLIITPNSILPKNIDKKDFLKTAIELENSKKYLLAIKAYKLALKRWENDKDTLFGLANNYFLIKDYKKAKNLYEKILKIEKDAKILNNLALTYLKLNRCDKAIKFIKEAISLDKENIKIYKDSLNEIYKKCR